MTAASEAPRRSDARRNHDLIVAAALAVFAEKGLHASVPEVAARAGVGKATVYRNYPTKADLVTAVALDRLQWLEVRAEQATREDDAWAALRSYTEDVFGQLKSDRALSEALRDQQSPEADAARGRCRALIDTLIERGQREGSVRAGVDANDFRILLGGLADQLHREGISDRADWRRYAGLAADALRAPAG